MDTLCEQAESMQLVDKGAAEAAKEGTTAVLGEAAAEGAMEVTTEVASAGRANAKLSMAEAFAQARKQQAEYAVRKKIDKKKKKKAKMELRNKLQTLVTPASQASSVCGEEKEEAEEGRSETASERRTRRDLVIFFT